MNLVAPAVNRVLKAANDRKSQCRDSRRKPVDHAPGLGRCGLNSLADRLLCDRPLVTPVTGHKLAAAVQNSAGWPQPERRQHRIPGQNPENVAVRLQHRILDDTTNQFTTWQFANIRLAPLRQEFACAILVASVQGIPDVREMVAELAKAQRHVEQRRAPEGRKGPAQQIRQQHVDGERKKRGQSHREAPDDPSVIRPARIEIPVAPASPTAQRRMHRIAARQRPNLLQQQGKQNGKEAHGRIIPSAGRCDAPMPGAPQAERKR